MQPLLDGMKAADSVTYAVTISLLKILGGITIVAVIALLELHLVKEVREFIRWKHHHPPVPQLGHALPLGNDAPMEQAAAWQPGQAQGAQGSWLTRALELVGFLSILTVVLAGLVFTIAKANEQNKQPTTTPQHTEEVFL